jgi:hypothetical protein
VSLQKFDHHSDKRLISGVSGTGKTTLFEALVRKEKAGRKFIYDHQGEFSRRFGVPPVFFPEQMCEATAHGGWVVFDPVEMFPGKSADGFEFFCDYVLAVSAQLNGRKIIGCDELQKLISNRDEPQELLAVLDTGRRYQLDAFFISQAPNRIHNGVRNQLTFVYTFRQSDANALAYLQENGFDPDAIRNLPKGKYLWRNLDSGESGEGGSAF